MQRVVFGELVHDFPQRVTCRLREPTRLVASVDGALKGELKRIDFVRLRVGYEVPC